MKKRDIIVLTLLILVFLTGISTAETDNFSPEFFRELADAVNEKPEIEIPDFEILELTNGIKFYLAEDSSLPIFEITGYINSGQINETEKNAGISSLMTELMLKATENYDESELSLFKEKNALSLNLRAGTDRISITANSLNTDSDKLLSLLAEILIRPKFAGTHFERVVKEYQQLYRQNFYSDSALLDMHFFKNLYGKHPYGYNYDYNLILDFLKKTDSNSLKEYYRQRVNPKNTVIIISGDFESEELKRELKNKFSDWKNSSFSPKKEYVNVNPDLHQKVIVVNKADATQANMRIGYNFYSGNYSKRIPFLMGNRIFGGGGFNSRLMKNLRSDKGYVYGISARTNYYDYGGSYYINLSLEPEKAAAARAEIKNEMVKIKNRTEVFKEKELFENVNLYNAVFPKSYQHQIDVLDTTAYQLEFNNKSKNYLNNFIKQYNGLEVEEVQQIFAEELYPEILFTVIVGPAEKIVPHFKKAGIEVEVINN